MKHEFFVVAFKVCCTISEMPSSSIVLIIIVYNNVCEHAHVYALATKKMQNQHKDYKVKEIMQ